MSDLKIDIHSRNDHNTITEKEYPKLEENLNHLKSMGGHLASKGVRIIFEPSAVLPLFDSIRWGSKCKPNDVEQAGILMGNYYRDSSGGAEVIWGDVIAVIPAAPELVYASFKAIDIPASAWRKLNEDATEYRTENLQTLGWYHTHLGHINTRFTSIDTRTQRITFTYKYSFGVVFNPNQERWSAFYGPDSQECIGELIFDEALEKKYGKPQITIKQINDDSELHDGSVIHRTDQSDGANSTPELLSLGQLFVQFYDGFKKLVLTPKRDSEYRHVGRPVRTRQPESIVSSQQPTSHITILRGTEVVKTRYYNMNSDSLVEQMKFQWTIVDKDIIDLVHQIRHQHHNVLTGEPIYAKTFFNASNQSVLIILSRSLFNDIINSNETKRTINSADISYAIFINDRDPKNIDVRVIRISKEQWI